MHNKVAKRANGNTIEELIYKKLGKGIERERN